MKRVKRIIMFVFGLVFIAFSSLIVYKMNGKTLCKEVVLTIKDTLPGTTIHSNEIRKFIATEKSGLIGKPMDKIDLVALEKKLEKFPAIRDAQVYSTLGGRLVFEITQRVPVIRVINADGEQFYIDNEGYTMPLTDMYTSRVVVANGLIRTKFNRRDTTSLQYIEPKEGSSKKVLKDLYLIARYIFKNPFWKAQIEQMYVNEQGDIELIPKIGAHIIVFGDAGNYEWKFIKLEAMYKEGFRVKGWNNYKTINLKFSNQVVCTKI